MAVRTWLMSYELRTALSLRDEEVASGQDAMSRGARRPTLKRRLTLLPLKIGPVTLTFDTEHPIGNPPAIPES